jgi:hypothetical protein
MKENKREEHHWLCPCELSRYLDNTGMMCFNCEGKKPYTKKELEEMKATRSTPKEET